MKLYERTLTAAQRQAWIKDQLRMLEWRKTGFVYFIDCPAADATKVGYASKVSNRFSSLQAGCPFRLVLRDAVPGDKQLEYDLHNALEEWAIRGEWFATHAVVKLLAELEAINDERAREVETLEAMEVWKPRNYSTPEVAYAEYVF